MFMYEIWFLGKASQFMFLYNGVFKLHESNSIVSNLNQIVDRPTTINRNHSTTNTMRYSESSFIDYKSIEKSLSKKSKKRHEIHDDWLPQGEKVEMFEQNNVGKIVVDTFKRNDETILLKPGRVGMVCLINLRQMKERFDRSWKNLNFFGNPTFKRTLMNFAKA